MKAAKWGGSLAVRLLGATVKALRLGEGDDIEIHIDGPRELAVSRKLSQENF